MSPPSHAKSRKKTYKARSEATGTPLTTLWYRDHGRKTVQERAALQQYLTPQEEKALVNYLLTMSRRGYPLRVKACRTLAHEIALRRHSNFQALPENSEIKPPGKNWAQAFRRRHPELKAARLKAIPRERDDSYIYDKIVEWFTMIEKELGLPNPDILACNTYNMDETGVMLSMLNSVKVLVGKEELKTYRGTGVNREQITAIECISADGRQLEPLIIWPASTHRSSWTTHPTPGWHYAHSPNGYTDSVISLYWIQHVFHPLTKERAGKKPRVLINDGFGTHESLEILKFCDKNNIILCRLPSHTSHKLQPCDIGVFAPLKEAYRDEVERLYRGGAGTIRKEHFPLLYDRARRKAFTPRNIKAGWSKSGMWPLNPQRVLDEIQKPIVRNISTVPIPCISLDDTQSVRPPETPTTSDALTALCQSIDSVAKTDSLDPITRMYIKKLVNAAENAFTDRSMMLGENEELFRQNCEKEVRASTRAKKVGSARVMKYEEILKEQELRDKKQFEKKATPGRPRKKQVGLVQPKQRSKQIKGSEREAVIREIAELGFEDYCSVMEF